MTAQAPARTPSLARRLPAALRARPELPLGLLILLAVLLAWEAATRFGGISALLLPSPLAVWQALVTLFASGQIWPHLWVTGSEVLGGFLLGSLIGLVLGCLIGRFPLLEKTIYPYIVALQSVPKVAVAPIIVIWLGFGFGSKLAIASLISFFPVIANTIVGLRTTPADQVEMMTAFTGTPSQVFWHARLPHALPYIFAGLNIAVVLAVIGAIVGEFVGAQAGLGYLILQRQFTMDVAGVFAILVVLSAIGIGLHEIVRMIRRRVIFWLDEEPDRSGGA
jgi:NitT/TauT family transport system permease protein